MIDGTLLGARTREPDFQGHWVSFLVQRLASLPGLTRQSIVLAKRMDARVEPAHDEGRELLISSFQAPEIRRARASSDPGQASIRENSAASPASSRACRERRASPVAGRPAFSRQAFASLPG